MRQTTIKFEWQGSEAGKRECGKWHAENEANSSRVQKRNWKTFIHKHIYECVRLHTGKKFAFGTRTLQDLDFLGLDRANAGVEPPQVQAKIQNFNFKI